MLFQEPTEEDIKRLLSEEQLKELCLGRKCRVEAYRWNPVFDYKIYFEKRNRFSGKSEVERRALLAKAVNRYKSTTLKYDEEEMNKTRRQEWIMRKKDSLLSLDLWAHERSQKNKDAMVNRSERDDTVQQTQESSAVSESNNSFFCISDTTHTEDDAGRMSEEIIEEISEAYNSDVIRARGVDRDICNLFDVNTESMTVDGLEDSEDLIPSQGVHSQDVFHNNYEEFDNGIPMTSTQSQHRGTQEEI